MTPDELATYQADVQAEAVRSNEIITAEAARMLEAQRADLLAKRAAMLAKGYKPWRLTVSDIYALPGQQRQRTMMFLHRTARQAQRGAESAGYEVHSVEPWAGDLPDPL